MKAAKIIRATLHLLIVVPIWWYLLVTILRGINASDLTWFLFWVYIPVAALCHTLGIIVEKAEK